MFLVYPVVYLLRDGCNPQSPGRSWEPWNTQTDGRSQKVLNVGPTTPKPREEGQPARIVPGPCSNFLELQVKLRRGNPSRVPELRIPLSLRKKPSTRTFRVPVPNMKHIPDPEPSFRSLVPKPKILRSFWVLYWTLRVLRILTWCKSYSSVKAPWKLWASD